jgi:anti-sigma factor RsiW
MTTRQVSIDEDDFQAFVDGQLPPDRRRAVMAYIAASPEEAARMGEYRTLSDALHGCFDEVLHEPLPKRLTVAYYRERQSWGGRLKRWFGLTELSLVPRLAAFALLLAISGGSGWWLHGVQNRPHIETPAMSFARLATNAHLLFASDLRHPVEFGADQQDSLLLWLSERLGEAVHAPDLQEMGFALVGGRLLPASGQPAAQLMYENPDAQRITLYIRGRWATQIGSTQEGIVNFAGDGGVSRVYWIEGPLAYALIGELDREQLFAAAKTIQQQVQPPTVPAEQTATTAKDAT